MNKNGPMFEIAYIQNNLTCLATHNFQEEDFMKLYSNVLWHYCHVVHILYAKQLSGSTVWYLKVFANVWFTPIIKSVQIAELNFRFSATSMKWNGTFSLVIVYGLLSW